MYTDMSQGNPKSKIQHQIDENLKRIYDETLKEQLPDRLTQLLQQLREKSGKAQDDPEQAS
jgi:tryptophanyl-tRNA synthetase